MPAATSGGFGQNYYQPSSASPPSPHTIPSAATAAAARGTCHEVEICDHSVPIYLQERRHVCRIEGQHVNKECWRMKERMKTVSVALVLCLNIEVDPPDILKTKSCARMETWIDPRTTTKPMEHIAANLQQQYQRWQPKARYKHVIDPTRDDVKKLCTSLRRNAKDDRILVHYNGHGVPRPTANSEIWVFNKNYSQYIPLPLHELHSWTGAPSIYLFDCSSAGQALTYFRLIDQHSQHSHQRQRHSSGSVGYVSPASTSSTSQHQSAKSPPSSASASTSSEAQCIVLAACGSCEVLPQRPSLPADLFTCCLITPVKIALRWFVLSPGRRLVSDVTLSDLDLIPGQLTDRRTMLGELNWIFTSITDTIAWNTLPRGVFQRLFRQDLLVASLFRNFLLAERIMKANDCNPVTLPPLPNTHQHGMWSTWDLAVDACLIQLKSVLKTHTPRPANFTHSLFFEEQLSAFQVWLQFGVDVDKPPEQLPVVLQVLLSQAHRVRALDLLSRFLDLGPWAVNQALSVGIFPYVLKLLQAPARELRPLLVIIWAKIMTLDPSCQVDLVRDCGHRYFLDVLTDHLMPTEHRTMAAFVLATMVRDYRPGQSIALKSSLTLHCVEQMDTPDASLRCWLAITLGHLWSENVGARWAGVRDLAHEKLFTLLSDRVPEVRSAAVFALGTFMNSVQERTEHSDSVDHIAVMSLLKYSSTDASPMIRRELVVALGVFVRQFERKFVTLSSQESLQSCAVPTPGGGSAVDDSRSSPGKHLSSSSSSSLSVTGSSPANSASPVPRQRHGVVAHVSLSFGSVYWRVWRCLNQMTSDPDNVVTALATHLVQNIRNKVSGKDGLRMQQASAGLAVSGQTSHSSPDSTLHTERQLAHGSGFVDWMESVYALPLNLFSSATSAASSDSDLNYYKQCRFSENNRIRCEAAGQIGRLPASSPRCLLMSRRLSQPCTQLLFSPYSRRLLVANKKTFSVWDYTTGAQVSHYVNHVRSAEGTRITCLQLINSHLRPLLAVASSDGIVRVWCDYALDMETYSDDPKPSCSPSSTLTSPTPTAPTGSSSSISSSSSNDSCRMLTSWQVSEMSERSSASATGQLQISWRQCNGQLVTGAQGGQLAVWDVEKEMRLRQLSAGVDSTVTSLSTTDHMPYLVVSGHASGSVAAFDTRVADRQARVTVWYEHCSFIVDSRIRHSSGTASILTGDQRGLVKTWDVRKASSVATFSTNVQDALCMSFHPTANLMACGSVNRNVTLHSLTGNYVDTILPFDQSTSNRSGPVCCVTLNPVSVVMASATSDGLLSVHSTPPHPQRSTPTA